MISAQGAHDPLAVHPLLPATLRVRLLGLKQAARGGGAGGGAAGLFSPSLGTQRYETVTQLVRSSNATSMVDVGEYASFHS